MDILFSDRKLRKAANNHRLLVRRYGDRQARKIRTRLDDLRAAVTLEDLRPEVFPPARCHELTGDRAGQLSVDVVHPYRLIFVPADNPVPSKPDGGLDWTRVTAVEIIEIEDTHG